MWARVFAGLLFLVAVATSQCNTGLKNLTLPDNGDVCELLTEPSYLETTCAASIASGLNATLAACAGDTYIEIELAPNFDETGPFFFPDVRKITLIGGGTSLLRGAQHRVLGNTTALDFRELVLDGEGTTKSLFDPPLRSNNMTLTGVLMMQFHGYWALLQEACTYDTKLTVLNSYFYDNWGASLFNSGLYEYDVESNIFDRCGGFGFGATFLKTHWASNGTDVFFNNSQWVLYDEQPPVCITYLDGGEHLRCRDGVFECENLGATINADDCPRDYNKSFIDPATNQTVWEVLFRPFCRRYEFCQCEEVVFRDVSNVSVADFAWRVGDVIYPYITLECQPGTNLVGGGAIGSVAPLAFVDPSFEADDNPGPGFGWNTSGNVIIDNTITKPKSRTGSKRVICNGQQDQWFEQWVNFTTPGAYLVSFWGARRDNQRNNYGGGFLELWLDGVQTVQIADPTFFDTMIADLTYYEFLFPPLNVGTAGAKVLRIRCNFVNTQNLEFAIDDISSRESGLEIIEFTGGQGLGPPPLSDPADYIAGNPLTSDAYIAPLPCPACPDAPARPSNIPCNYAILDSFDCFPTIFDGNVICLEPDLFNAGFGAYITDPSFENVSYYWTEVSGAPTVLANGFIGTQNAHSGTHFILGIYSKVVALEQNVSFPNSGVYTLSFWALRLNNLASYQGKFISYYIDGMLADTLDYTDISSKLLSINTWYSMLFEPQLVLAGTHTLRLVVDMTGGGTQAAIELDDLQFVGATSSPSATLTPTPSRTPSPTPGPINGTQITLICNNTNFTFACFGQNTTVLCNNTNITVPCQPPVPPPTISLICNGTNTTVECPGQNVTVFCNGTNITLPCVPPPLYPPTQLRCIDDMVYLGENLFVDGCIVPANLTVEFQGNNVTANQCVTSLAAAGCTLPEMFQFSLNDTLIDCVSLSLGIMRCDCSVAKLLQFSNRSFQGDVCAYEFDQIPRSARGFFIRENRAQQLRYGGCSRRIDFDTVVKSSVAYADYFDPYGVGREILRQSNLLWGLIPDATQPNGVRTGTSFLQDGLTVYERECVDNCPQFNPTRPGSNIPYCIVDNAGSDFDSSVYPTIQDAVDDGNCTGLDRAIWVRESENFYQEDVDTSHANVLIFATGNATLMGSIIGRGDLVTLFIRGLTIVPTGRSDGSVIDIDLANSLVNYTLVNCYFSGNGVKDLAITRNRNHRIEDVFLGYNYIRNFAGSVLQMKAGSITAWHNTIQESTGRLLKIDYRKQRIVEHNLLIDSRGAPDIKKPALIEMQFTGNRDAPPCFESPTACGLRRNIQRMVLEEPEDADDFKETGLLLRGDAVYLESVRDNVIIKARTGLRLRKVDLVVPEETAALIGANEWLEITQFFNPLVRPTRTRRESDGEDFMIDGYFEGSRVSRLRCSFPDCVPPERRPKRCIANLNFESFYSEQFGWETFTNISQASFFCPLNLIEVTVFGGATIIPERWAIRRPQSNNILRPLLNEPTNEEILVGDAPVPDQFVAKGVDVTVSDVPYFASLLDANTTYGFGIPTKVFVYTDLLCICPGENLLFHTPMNYLSSNCTTLIGPYQDPDLCADATAGDPQVVSCTVGPDSEVACQQVGTQIFGIIEVGVYECTLPLTVLRNVSVLINTTLVNGTLVNITEYQLLNFTEYAVVQQIGNLEQCVLTTVDVYADAFEFSTLNQCTRPAYYGVGSNFRSLNISLEHMSLNLDYGEEYERDEINVPMLSTLEPSIDMLFVDMWFNGRGVEPPGRMFGVALKQGLDVPTQLGRKHRNRRPAAYSRTRFMNCKWFGWLSYNSILGNSEGSADDESEVDAFPHTIALDVEVVNVLIDDPTEIWVVNCTMDNIDKTALNLRFANATYIYNNSAWHLGGRALNTPAAIFIHANPASVNSLISMWFNNFTQTLPVTYPFLGDLAIPAFQTMVWVTGLRDQAIYDCLQLQNATIDQCLESVFPTCCPALVIVGNFWCGLPYGLRIVGERDAVSEYILRSIPGNPVPIFDDELSPAREIALVNNVSIDGTVCDIVIGPPDQDWRKEHLCCNEACVPKPPSACRVNSTDPRITPTHPWYDIFWFQDPNQCMEDCQASSGRCNLEEPAADLPYEVRLDFAALQPPILQYTATWSGPVTINVLSTFPMAGLLSPPAVSIPIEWTDSSLSPLSVIIIPLQPPFDSLSIEVTGSLQMPANIPEAVPTDTPPNWLMDIRIVITFCAPSNPESPVPSFPLLFNYISPPINVITPSGDYAAVLVLNWLWDSTATLQTSLGRELRGIGLPKLLCNGHSPSGANITVRDVEYLHADPCVDFTLDMTTCPCTVPGLATWEQSDTTPAPGLRLLNSNWDGRGYEVLAIDGEFHGRFEVRASNFVDYRKAAPGYVVRVRPSPTEDCCTNTCRNEFLVMNNNFIGEDSVSMTGNVVFVGPTEFARIEKNTFIDAGFQDAAHAEAALVYLKSCPGKALQGALSFNTAERTSGTVVTTRVPPNDCYWTAYEVDELSLSPSFEILDNRHTQGSGGAQICLRPINWPLSSPSTDCQRALRNLRGQNLFCDGARWDVVEGPCSKDVCLARTVGCDPGDTDCQAVTIPPCATNDYCLACEGTCSRPVFDPPMWFVALLAGVGALLLCCCLCCILCTLSICLASRTRHRVVRRKTKRRLPAITTMDEQQALTELTRRRAEKGI